MTFDYEGEAMDRVPRRGVAKEPSPIAGGSRGCHAATAGRMTMGLSLMGAMVSSVM